MAAPYLSLKNYKYSVKLKPGNQRNRKISRNIIGCFLKTKTLTIKEKFLIRNISYDYLSSVIRSNVYLIKK